MQASSPIDHATTVFRAGCDLLNTFIVGRPKKGDVRLDFLSTVLRIAVLGHYELQSRIAVERHKIVIQRASKLQWMTRTVRRDSRDQIGEIILPVCTSLIVYPPNTPELCTIYKACQVGLRKLIDTYTGHMTDATMKSRDLTYVTLQSCIGFIDQQLNKEVEARHEGERAAAVIPFDIQKYLYSESLRTAVQRADLWTKETLVICANQLQEATRTSAINKAEHEGYLNSLLMLVEGKDKRFEDLIAKI